MTPTWKQSGGNAAYFANLVNDALSEHFANSSNMSNSVNFTTANHTGNSYRLINGSSAGISGTRPIDYADTFYSSNYFFAQRGGSTELSQSYYNHDDLYLNKINLTTPYNILKSTTAHSYGVVRLGTPCTQILIPYYFDLTMGGVTAHGNNVAGSSKVRTLGI